MRRALPPPLLLAAAALAVVVGTSVAPAPLPAAPASAAAWHLADGLPTPQGHPVVQPASRPVAAVLPSRARARVGGAPEGPRLVPVAQAHGGGPLGRTVRRVARPVWAAAPLFGAAGADRCRLICVYRL